MKRPDGGDPLALAAWAQEINAIELWRIVNGRTCQAISVEIRASGRAVAALMPFERLMEAEGLIKAQHARQKTKPKEMRGTVVPIVRDDNETLTGFAGGGATRR